MNAEEFKKRLPDFEGTELTIMEVCGSHTAAIQKNGIPSLLPPQVRLAHGPGCPVCVAVSDYIDRLIGFSLKKDTAVVTFGDLLRVPGSERSLSEAKGRVEMVYSPMDILILAEKEPETEFIFAALGFETTAPVYALLVKELEEKAVTNVKLLTALKTMPAVIDRLLSGGSKIDGFLAPGHVSVVTGEAYFRPLSEKYGLPFVISGFSGEELLTSLLILVENRGRPCVINAYPKVVRPEGNPRALRLMNEVFEPGIAAWRGLGEIEGSGLYLKEKYRRFDAGSFGITKDHKKNPLCLCHRVLAGMAEPNDCSLFGSVCTPLHPEGPCMVSEEGGCHACYGS